MQERRSKVVARTPGARWSWDAIGHWGGSLGNLATHFNAGFESRLGWLLPDDFGSAPLRPAGENTSPRAAGAEPGWAGHAFVILNARWVLRDLTLDGNTFKPSHRVDKEPLVADLGYGLVLTNGPWKLAFARYHRTREFRGQPDVPVYGSITISHRFERPDAASHGDWRRALGPYVSRPWTAPGSSPSLAPQRPRERR